MLTMNYIIDNKYPFDHLLTQEDKVGLREENRNGDFSYICLMNEMFVYRVTVSDLLRGWGGVNIFKI